MGNKLIARRGEGLVLSRLDAAKVVRSFVEPLKGTIPKEGGGTVCGQSRLAENVINSNSLDSELRNLQIEIGRIVRLQRTM